MHSFKNVESSATNDHPFLSEELMDFDYLKQQNSFEHESSKNLIVLKS